MLRKELLLEDPDSYKDYIRMDDIVFKELLSYIEHIIKKQDTQFRESVSADKRLAVTLRYLASGNTYRDLMFATRIHESTISLIVPEVCQAIVQRLMPEYVKMPASGDEWKQIANEFETLWNFPMCLGALDGKHINFQAPRSTGSFYYNYKGAHSIVLLALVDANYKFIYVDVGVNGRISDGGVFRESTLRKALNTNGLNLPEDDFLPGTTVKAPFVIVGDDAFPLTKRIMKPFPQRGLSMEKKFFNYRLSRARRVVENAFGILSNRFRILQSTINLSPEKAEIITMTCCVLHNFLATKTLDILVQKVRNATYTICLSKVEVVVVMLHRISEELFGTILVLPSAALSGKTGRLILLESSINREEKGKYTENTNAQANRHTVYTTGI